VREDMWRAQTLHWMFAALTGAAAVACGGTLQTKTSSGQGDGGIDSGGTVSDGAVEAAADSGQDAAMPTSEDPGDGATDLSDGAGDEGAADAADVTDSADASAPIPCTETATCAAPISLGSIWGGQQAGINEGAAGYGDHSDWYLVEIQPYQPPAPLGANVSVSVWITPPPSTEYTLTVYLSTSKNYPGTCVQTPYTSTPTGQDNNQQLHFTFPDSDQYPAMGWLTIHVIASPGAQCATGAPWNLQVSTAD
jgi:hypothetical protein